MESDKNFYFEVRPYRKFVKVNRFHRLFTRPFLRTGLLRAGLRAQLSFLGPPGCTCGGTLVGILEPVQVGWEVSEWWGGALAPLLGILVIKLGEN